MTEQENVKRLIAAIGHDWTIHREVEGKSIISGACKRIDLVIVSKEKPFGKHLVFGVECKRPQLTSLNDYSRWIRQAVGYTQCAWGTKQVQMPILVYPKVDGGYSPDIIMAYEHIMGAFGIGSVFAEDYERDFGQGKVNWQILMSGSKVWSTFYGFNQSMSKTDFKKKITL